ncbi:MAG: 2Fe-2S iron-sulfur cluster-binding protein [Betaproteobacteria bacterium]|nr:2Fe-2S iron-sulfur cluster-binding protein [Betaproteobacteria bacterium]
MARLLTLSRAARLVGVRRGALQSKIRSGELAAFEGMVSADDLARAYPQAALEDNAGLERFEAIKDAAFAERLRERLLPSSEVLVARLAELSRERAGMQAALEHYRAIVAELQAKLGAAGEAPGVLAWLKQRLEPAAQAAEPLLAQESFLRIMTAHVQIRPSGREFFVDGNDSLLEAALRAGLSLDYGCSAGSCGKCKARVVSGQVHRTRHADYALTAAEKAAGVLLMCCHTALTDLVLEAREAHGAADMPLQSIEARVKAVSPVGADMQLLHLQTPRTNRLRFLAGQWVTLSLADGASAAHAVASCPCDERNLHFHIPRRAGDAFAGRVFAGLQAADTVRIDGPRGEFVLDEASPRPLVFIARDTGFAPVKSILEHAMALDAAETLALYRSASGERGHYLDNLCRSWSDALDNFRYVPLTEDDRGRGVLGRVLQDHPRLEGHDVYLAGPAAWAGAVEFGLLERGLPRAQLHVSALEV